MRTTETDVPTSLADAPARMNHREVLEALSGILLGMFVSMLATSVVSSSLPRIIAALGGSQSSFTWVVTATLLTTTISTPIWGKLADLVSRKLLVQLSLAVTVVSAAAAGMSQNTAELITARAFQGIGAGGMTALGVVLIADIISPRDRGRYMGLTGAVMAVVTVGGPLLGGVLTDGPGWRWNFFVGLPFAVLAIVVLQRTLHLPPPTRRRVSVDVVGALLVSAGVALLLLWVTFAGDRFAWVSWQSAAMVGGALVLLALVPWAESRAAEPIIPLRLFRNRTLVLAVVASVAVGIAMYGTAVFLSQYMQLARGKTPTQSGLMTIPMMVGVFLASTVTGQVISRTGRYRRYMIGGGGLLTAGLALMGTIHYDTNFWLVATYMLVLGAGVGMLMQNLVLAAQNTLDLTDMGSGSSLIAFFRTMGGAIGVSALGAVLSARLPHLIADGLVGIGVDPAKLGGSLSGTSIPDLSTLPGAVRPVVEKAFGDGIATLFLIGAPFALVSLVAVLFLKETPLRRQSTQERRLAADDTGTAQGDLPAADPEPEAEPVVVG